VRFGYGAGTVLDGLTPEVGAGETHAIVGATGAGKSTVVKLLLRLYDAKGGSVTVDGVEVDALAFASLRGAIGYVGQDTFLFDGTVAENLRYGAPDASPSILVLDEATSAVDNETEATIQRSLLRVSHQRTTIVIAHRLSTIRHADAIHVLQAAISAAAATRDR
jgi:ATP-binding cassette subfamily B protein